MTSLYHYTCYHRHMQIQAIANEHGTAMLKGGRPRAVWATDLELPNRQALGIAAPCPAGDDRGEFRYRILQPEAFAPWPRVRRHLPDQVVAGIEAESEILIAHWWVSASDVLAVLDPP